MLVDASKKRVYISPKLISRMLAASIQRIMEQHELSNLVRQGFRQGLINVLMPRPWVRDSLNADSPMELSQKLAEFCDDDGWTFSFSSSLITFSKSGSSNTDSDNVFPMSATLVRMR